MEDKKNKRVRKENLPKGISWVPKRRKYIGRFMYKGKHHILYDTEWKRLEQRLNELRREVIEGRYIPGSKITLDTWFNEWMETYKRSTLKPSTYTSYCEVYRIYIKNSLGEKKLMDIRAMDVQRLYNELSQRGISHETIRHAKVILDSSFKKAVQNELIRINPIPLADLPKKEDKKERYVFNQSEQKEFLDLAKQSCLCDFLYVTIMTGMRNGEARALRWQDVDFANRVINIKHTFTHVDGKDDILGSPKTKTSYRKIPMTSRVEDILIRRKKETEKAGLGDDAYVLGLSNGKHITARKVGVEIAKIEKQMLEKGIQVGHFTCHTLRHVFATRALESGMNPQVLKTILGHSSLNMTMVYSHVLDAEKEKQMRLIEKMF